MNTNNNNRTPRRYPSANQTTAPGTANSGQPVNSANNRSNVNHTQSQPRTPDHRPQPSVMPVPAQHVPAQPVPAQPVPASQAVNRTPRPAQPAQNRGVQPTARPQSTHAPRQYNNGAQNNHTSASHIQAVNSVNTAQSHGVVNAHNPPQSHQQAQIQPKPRQTQAQTQSQPQMRAQTPQNRSAQPLLHTPQENKARQQMNQPYSATTRTYTRKSVRNDTPSNTTGGKKPINNNKPSKGRTTEKAASKERDNTLSSVIKAMMYIVFVIVASGFLSYYIIAIGNDVFAFVKSDEVVLITLDDYATTSDVAQQLYENEVISFPKIFELYVKFRGSLTQATSGGYLTGTFEVTPSLSYDDLVFALVPKAAAREEVSITIREGLTVNEIITIFVEKGIGTREGFIDVIQNYDFDYWFIDELGELDPNRTYRLEGYLYPDTYYFYTDSSEYAVIKKFLDRFNEMFDERYKESCEAVGMSVDEVIILASMIQMEGKYVSEYGAISSVFHNRLNNPRAETAGFLNSDATIQYALNERKSVLTSEDTELDSPYNTYEHKGLPPGPICCPSLDAMNYAMYPDDTKYFYFVSRTNGYSLFAETAEEHTENIILARSGQ